MLFLNWIKYFWERLAYIQDHFLPFSEWMYAYFKCQCDLHINFEDSAWRMLYEPLHEYWCETAEIRPKNKGYNYDH